MWKEVYGYEVNELGQVRIGNKYYKGSNHDGYKRVGTSPNRFYIHRLVAIAFIPNVENLSCIDHINGIRDDNRIENLRWCDKSTNGMNRTKQINNKSGIKGVSWYKNKWHMEIKVKGKRVRERFDTLEEAIEARRLKAHELFGEFCHETER
jgi:hypothetical protein